MLDGLSPDALTQLPADAPGGRRGVVRLVAGDLEAVTFFERLLPGADVDALLRVLSLTSPELSDLVGDPARVPEPDRAYGAGSGWVMPAFTRRARPSRFSDGRHGVWYVAWQTETAVAETLYHTARFLQETSQPPQVVARQVLTADIAGFAAVLSTLKAPLGPAVHDPVSYATSQLVGGHLRRRGSEIIVYHSVRRRGGVCGGILVPRAVRHCRRTGTMAYAWDGAILAPTAMPGIASITGEP